MASRLKFWKKNDFDLGLLGTIDNAGQDVFFDPAVVRYLLGWQQHGPRATEAGGQIFGVVSPSRVNVKAATGPYRGDERERYHYRSNPRAAQRAIDNQANQGLHYLGEWHTHPEDVPTASLSDLDAITTLGERSKIVTSALLLVIIGRAQPPAGFAVHSIEADKNLRRWNAVCHRSCQEATTSLPNGL